MTTESSTKWSPEQVSEAIQTWWKENKTLHPAELKKRFQAWFDGLSSLNKTAIAALVIDGGLRFAFRFPVVAVLIGAATLGKKYYDTAINTEAAAT